MRIRATTLMVVAGAMLAGPVRADTPVERLPGTITTHATARGRLANTVADVSIGVEARTPTLVATQAALTAGSDKLMAYLRAQGVERLRTEQLSLTPHTVAEKAQAERIVGYDGSVQASFRVPAARLGAVVAGALNNGGNNLAGVTLNAREAELDAERARLGAEAAKIALAQADAVARATGRRLAAIRRIDVDPEQGNGTPMPMQMAVMKAAPAPAVPPMATEAGDAEITASVTMTVDLVETQATP